MKLGLNAQRVVYNPQDWTTETFEEFCESLKKMELSKFEIKIPYQLKDVWEKAALDYINDIKNK